jgi:SAM-dependent methyltransferase
MDTTTHGSNDAARDALVDRLFLATVGALELFSIHLGWRLGLYRALAEAGTTTADQLADRAGIDGRYAREWLEQQAVAGLLAVDEPGAGEADRRYSLPAAHADVLTDEESLAHVAPFAPMLVGIAGALPGVVAAYRTGTGVPYAAYGEDMRHGQGAINRPVFTHELADWVATMPDVDARLRSQPPARIADLGCGLGFSTVALKRAYPAAEVSGVDADEASIAEARRRADDADVRFVVADASDLTASGPYDLICLAEALHDMPRPVQVLTAARTALTPGGSVLVIDERVADAFTAPGDAVERIMYGWSVTHCLPASRVDADSAALGTVLRTDVVRRLAAESGFADVEVLPVDNDFFRCYRLHRG